jgi:hypothetical protein
MQWSATVPIPGPRTKIKSSIAIYKHWRKPDRIGIMVAAAVVRRTDKSLIIAVQSANCVPVRTHGNSGGVWTPRDFAPS